MTNNYRMNLIEVRKFANPELFRTDLRSVFGFIQHSESKQDLKTYVFEHELDFSNLADDAFDVIAEVTGTEELGEMKKNVQNPEGGYDMCKAIKDMIEDSKAEGKAEAILELLGFLGEVPMNLQNRIYQEKDTEILKRWLVLAARAETVGDFAEKME
ncbi:MAG: hypothetical protein PHV18_01325 [Lachnospiraceae bacterium]|nr:hypothetical protein [Lachnospiraceae bacterium]